MDLFLAKPDSLPSKCKNSPFVDRRHKHIVTYDTQITRNNVLGTTFMKETKYRELRSIDLEKAKLCILEGLDKCIWSWCCMVAERGHESLVSCSFMFR